MRFLLGVACMFAASGLYAQDPPAGAESFTVDESQALTHQTTLEIRNAKPIGSVIVLNQEGCEVESISVGKRKLTRVGEEFTDGSVLPNNPVLTLNHPKDESCRVVDPDLVTKGFDSQDPPRSRKTAPPPESEDGDDERQTPQQSNARGGDSDYGDDDAPVQVEQAVRKNLKSMNTKHQVDVEDSGINDAEVLQERAYKSKNKYDVKQRSKLVFDMSGSSGRSLGDGAPFSPHNNTKQSGNFSSAFSGTRVANSRISVNQNNAYRSTNVVRGSQTTEIHYRSR
jgi:hypothetical protein